MTSNGWTTRVDTMPAVKPATDSTREGEMFTAGCRPSRGGYTRGIVAVEVDEGCYDGGGEFGRVDIERFMLASCKRGRRVCFWRARTCQSRW